MVLRQTILKRMSVPNGERTKAMERTARASSWNFIATECMQVSTPKTRRSMELTKLQEELLDEEDDTRRKEGLHDAVDDCPVIAGRFDYDTDDAECNPRP